LCHPGPGACDQGVAVDACEGKGSRHGTQLGLQDADQQVPASYPSAPGGALSVLFVKGSLQGRLCRRPQEDGAIGLPHLHRALRQRLHAREGEALTAFVAEGRRESFVVETGLDQELPGLVIRVGGNGQ
jgi:hypothetical protein